MKQLPEDKPEYRQFGIEWEKELMKQRKSDLVTGYRGCCLRAIAKEEKIGQQAAAIERLKLLCHELWNAKYPYPENVQDLWNKFATENNLL